ncbi:putative TonB-dependent receptor [Caenibius tardaugens NBRC 16725]|uniref:Putative TonB-dependent receptor n=1 Tax=Caenibius tardaugens NBRC 16725 TaxID=1219035 RepID=U2YJQ4_9SPHN|nr:TonB-dependent receptor [Caenibius tardaugens]GAD48690.1 putative TonB-dependent receptor [Caenibius tardaugens NBRC 16725]
MRIHRNMTAYLFGAAAIALTSPAFAQSGGEENTSSPQIRDREIIVTAQRREERAQDVPIVISAFSDERLKQMNVNQAQDLYGAAPSLVVGNQGQATRDVQSFSIRGQSTGFLSSPAVAQYFAEVPLPAAVTLNLQGAPGLFIDLENVQVLAGPQGTLFGRNTTGGAVLFVPRKPTNEFEGYIEGSYGNYDFKGIEGAINVPLIDDKLMVRAAGAYQDRDGFTKDLVFNKDRDDLHWYSGRISVLMKPFEGFENLTIVYGSKSSNNGTGFIHDEFNIAGLKSPLLNFCSDTPGPIASCDIYRRQTEIAKEIGPRKTRMNVDEFSLIKLWGVINNTSFDISDNLTVRNIISFQRLKDNYASDQDATPLQQYEGNQNAGPPPLGPIPGLSEYGIPVMGYPNATVDHEGYRDDIKQFTEELQLQGNALDNKLNYTVGYFHYSAKPGSLWRASSINYCPPFATGFCPFSQTVTGVSNKSDAIYGQATLDFGALSPALDSLRLTAGYRYNWDTVTGFATNWRPAIGGGTASCLEGGLVANPAVPIGDVMDVCRFDATLKSKAATWTIGLDYKPMDNLMLYGKISKGYKAGGFNTFAVRTETRIFTPEELTTYEAGFKSDWELGTVPVKFNATYYYSDYKNIQRPTGDFNPDTGQSGARTMDAEATIQGIEIEASIRPIPGLEIGGNFSHTDADYKKFDVPIFAPTLACDGLKNFGETGDFTCMPFQFSTAYIYNIYASLDVPLGENMGNLAFYANYSHVSKQPTAPLGNDVTQPGSIMEPFGLLNGSIAWKGVAGTPVDITVFGNNLTNKLYRTSNSNTIDNLLVNSTVYGAPRMYGVKVRYNF